jgi:membrane-associated phospholipid phosphatase
VYERRPRELWSAAVALLVLLVSTWAATAGISEFEVRAFDAFNQGPDWLEQLLWLPMQLGSLFGPVLVAVVAWLLWRDWRPSVGSIVAGVVAWQLAKLLKELVDRGRPFRELDEFVRRGGTPTDGLGFVSGHSAVAFALATVVSPYLSRGWRWAAFALAATVGAARIHVGAHFPLDVVGGAALGCLIGFVWRYCAGVPTGDDLPLPEAGP